MSNKRTIVVAGALANKPHNGGNAWVVLSWVRGFQLLGFDVVFVEQLAPDACVDEQGVRCTFEPSTGRVFSSRGRCRCGARRRRVARV